MTDLSKLRLQATETDLGATCPYCKAHFCNEELEAKILFGWDKCLTALADQASEFNEAAAMEYYKRTDFGPLSVAGSHVQMARWQNEQDKAVIAALTAENIRLSKEGNSLVKPLAIENHTLREELAEKDAAIMAVMEELRQDNHKPDIRWCWHRLNNLNPQGGKHD